MKTQVAVATAVVSIATLALASPAQASGDCVVTGRFTGGIANFFETWSPCNRDPAQSWVLEQGWTRSSFDWELAGSGGMSILTCTPEVRLAGTLASQPGPFTYRAQGVGGQSQWVTYGMSQPLDQAVVSDFTSTPGTKDASYRLDCGADGLVSWSTPVVVVPAPPADRDPGVSIEDGADYVNTRRVTLYLGWERGNHIDRVKVSNDGGFAPSKSKEFELTGSDPITWDLVDLGNERLPKTVYVKYRVGSYPQRWDTRIYTDDIILDTIKPVVVSASLSGSGAATLAGPRMVRVKAKDNKSGLASIQVSAGKPRKSAKVLKYRTSVPAPKSSRVFVRVRDGAGKWSKWRSVA